MKIHLIGHNNEQIFYVIDGYAVGTIDTKDGFMFALPFIESLQEAQDLLQEMKANREEPWYSL